MLNVIYNKNYNYLKNSVIFLCFSFFSIIFCVSFFKKKFKKIEPKNFFLIKNCQLFLLGSSVFIFTFIFGSNADYRLIFLFFVLPYVLNYYQYKNKIFFLFCLFVSLNSLLFEKGYKYSLTYYMNFSFVYFCKIILLSYLCFTFGYIMRNYIFFRNKFI